MKTLLSAAVWLLFLLFADNAQHISAQACGGYLTAESDTFTSPYHPGQYRNYMHCIWTVNSTGPIQLTFTAFDMEDDPYEEGDWCYDEVEIYDGVVDRDNKLSKAMCGTDLPETVVTTGSLLTVVFDTDFTVVRTGFSADYVTIGPEQATMFTEDHRLSVNESDGSVVIRVGRDNVHDDMAMIKYAFLPDRSTATVNDDFLQDPIGGEVTFDAGATQTELEIPIVDDTIFELGGEKLAVRFYDETGTYVWLGRDVIVEIGDNDIDQGCGGNLVALPTSASISTPNFPGPYMNNLDCQWTITSNSSNPIRITFDSLDVEFAEYCYYDLVVVLDGDFGEGRILFELCGDSLPAPVISTGDVIAVEFSSDYTVRRPGFSAHYEEITPSTGTMMADNYYVTANENDVNVTIKISRDYTNEPGSIGYKLVDGKANLDYDFQGPSEGSLTFASGENETDLVIDLIDDTVYERSEKFFVRFEHSTGSYEWLGGDVTVKIYDDDEDEIQDCNATLTDPSGTIATPNHPGDYGNNVFCVWSIETTRQIQLDFTSFDIEDDFFMCNYDSVSVYDGTVEEGRRMVTYVKPPTS